MALAAYDELATVEVDAVAVEFDEFGDAEAAGEEEFDDGTVAEAGFGASVDGVEEVFDFVIMKESDLFADNVGKFNEGGVEGFDAAFGEVFEKAAEGDEMIGLSDDFEVFAVLVGFAVELEAEFAEEFLGDVDREEVGEFGVVAFDDAKIGGFLEDVYGNILEAQEVATVVVGGFFGATAFDF